MLRQIALTSADLLARAFSPPPPADVQRGPGLFPPGPPPRRPGLLGSVPYQLHFLFDSVGFVGKRFEQYGDIYYAPGKASGLYAIRHPDHLHEVLVAKAASFDKGHSEASRLSAVLGDGLVTSDGEVWRRHRRMIQPAFSAARIAGYAEVMIEEADKLCESWKDGDEVDVAAAMAQATLCAVSRALFRHDARGQAERIGRAMVAVQNSLSIPDVLPAWVPFPPRERLRHANRDLDDMIYRLIAERKARAKPPGEGAATDIAQTVSKSADLLEMLLSAKDSEGDGGGLTEREVRDELVTLFLAGHETTSNALTWALYLLAAHPEAEAKLSLELSHVLGGRLPSFADLERLPYTEQVLKEAMRLYPPAYMVARRAAEDTTIGGYPVAKGSDVVLWIYMTHRHPSIYSEPLAFRPERFSREEEAKLPRLAYLPFGAGPRTCIGKHFAMVEGRLMLAIFAQRFRFELAERREVAISPRVTLTPKGGLRMRLRAKS